MARLLTMAALALFFALAVGGGAAEAQRQVQCGALVQPSCLAKFGAGADIAAGGDCERQLRKYRDCLARAVVGSQDAAVSKDLGGLFKAAIHHYDRYGGGYEHRVLTGGVKTPGLVTIYERQGVIYFYGKHGLNRRASADRAVRSEVAEKYLETMSRIFDGYATWRERRAAFIREARGL